MYSVMSRSLWCVMKGFAVAPPAIMFIMGVSTSMKSWSSRYLRMERMMFERVTKMSRTSGFMIRSR